MILLDVDKCFYFGVFEVCGDCRLCFELRMNVLRGGTERGERMR